MNVEKLKVNKIIQIENIFFSCEAKSVLIFFVKAYFNIMEQKFYENKVSKIRFFDENKNKV